MIYLKSCAMNILYKKIADKLSLRFIANVVFALALVVFFHKARLFRAVYFMEDFNVTFNYFTFLQIRDLVTTLLFIMATISMAVLIFMSVKTFPRRYTACTVWASVGFILAMILRVYFVVKQHTECDRVIANPSTYFFIFICIMLIVANTEKSQSL